MNKIKLNVKYEWRSREKPLFPIVSHFKRNNRKIKKGLKTALIDISNTLNSKWVVETEVSN